MEKIVRQTLLFDFYGEMLTEHQQQVFEEVVCNDTGYSELAAREGVSRQSIHDLVRKCNAQLERYEEKMHLIEKFISIRGKISEIRRELDKADSSQSPVSSELIRQLTDEILREL